MISAATESERAPLIRSYVQGLPSIYTESVGNFYSPMASPEGSLYVNEPEQNEIRPALLTQEQVNKNNITFVLSYRLCQHFNLYIVACLSGMLVLGVIQITDNFIFISNFGLETN